MDKAPRAISVVLVIAITIGVVDLIVLSNHRSKTATAKVALAQETQGGISAERSAYNHEGNTAMVADSSKSNTASPSDGLVHLPLADKQQKVDRRTQNEVSEATAESKALSPEVAGNVERLRAILQSNSDNDTKELAAEALAKLGTEPAARALIDAIRNATGVYRENLLHELRSITNSAASPALVEALRDLQDMTLHRESRLVLLNMQSPAPAQAVVAGMNGATNEQQRLALAFTLSMLTSQDAIPALMQAGRAQDDLLATRSFMGLAHIGGTNALAALVELASLPANQAGERGEQLLVAIRRATITTGPAR